MPRADRLMLALHAIRVTGPCFYTCSYLGTLAAMGTSSYNCFSRRPAIFESSPPNYRGSSSINHQHNFSGRGLQQAVGN